MFRSALLLWFIPFFLIPLQSIGQEKVSFGSYSIDYQKKEGNLHGPYTSYYKNGQVRAKGTFQRGFRNGKWVLFARNGDTLLARNYKGLRNFDRTYPPIPEKGPFRLLMDSMNDLQRNDRGVMERLYDDRGRSPLWQGSVYLKLKKERNPLLYEENLLMEAIHEALKKDSSVKAYKTWKLDTAFDPIPRLKNYDDPSFSLYEACYFDRDRFFMTKEVWGIAISSSQKKASNDRLWFFYPDLRAHFSQIKLRRKEADKRVNSLDDHFFFRRYQGEVYRSYPSPEKRVDPNKMFSIKRRVAADGEVHLVEDHPKKTDSAKGFSSLERTDIYFRELEHKTWRFYLGR